MHEIPEPHWLPAYLSWAILLAIPIAIWAYRRTTLHPLLAGLAAVLLTPITAVVMVLVATKRKFKRSDEILPDHD